MACYNLDECCRRLHENDASLMEICLCNKGIGNEGAVKLAKAMKGNKTVQELHLGWNHIGDEGAIALADSFGDNKTLQKLNLYGNRIGDKGAIALAESFRGNEALQELSLGDNQIGDEGAIALAESFRDNKALQELNLGENQIGDEGAKALLQMLKEHNTTLTDLSIYGYPNSISNSLKREINSLIYPTPEFRMSCHRLRKNDPLLVKLNLSSKRNDLNSYRIGDDEAVILADAMRGNTTLEELYLQDNDIRDEGATALATTLPTLKTLDLSNNIISDEGATALATTLQGSPTLKTLNLSYNYISDAGTTALATTLQDSPTLKTLDLSGNRISNEGATALATTLQVSPTLKTLGLSGNRISNEGATALANGLGGNTILQSLNLGENDIGSNGATSLAAALMVNRTLQRLKLVNQLQNQPRNERMWTRQSYQAFLELSRDINFWVQVDIHLPPDDASTLEDEALCLKIRDVLTQLRLNACGRGRLEQAPRNTNEENVNVPKRRRLVMREQSSTQDWVNVLFNVHDIEDVSPWWIKLDCIYTLVRKNPNLLPQE